MEQPGGADAPPAGADPPRPPQAAAGAGAAGGGAAALRELYQRVKSSPLEVVAIDTAGVVARAPEGGQQAGAGGAGAGQQPTPTRYERAALRTRPSVLDRELRAVLEAPPTLEGVHSALERAVANLRATEAFDDVWAEIDGEPAVSWFWLGVYFFSFQGGSVGA